MRHFNSNPEKINIYDSNMKKVDYIPSAKQVIIRNFPQDNKDAISVREEFANAEKAAKTKVVPEVGKGIQKRADGSLAYTQRYGGETLNDVYGSLGAMSPKQQYKLGSQIGRSQSRLVEQANLWHDDLYGRNMTIPNPKKNKVYLIDNNALRQATPETLRYARQVGEYPKPYKQGFTRGIRFNNMEHFVCFAAPAANFQNIYETGLKNLLTNNTEPAVKKYIRKKKEQAEAEKEE